MLDLNKHISTKIEDKIKDGTYQWLLDHASTLNDGRIHVEAFIDGKENFWKRVMARVSGDFVRYKKMEEEIKKHQTGYMINLKIKQKHDRRFSQIRNSGTLVEKFLLYVMIKIKKYLLK